MAASKDYYQVLGVAETATVDEIKKAFRRLAKQYHPDRNPNNAQAAERFKEINEAHDVLSDPDKRKRYDQLRRYGAYAGAGRGGSAGAPGAGGVDFDLSDLGSFGGLGDLFSTIFGRRGTSGAERLDDEEEIETTVSIPFRVAALGGKVPVTLPMAEVCPTCSGSGAAPGATVSTCPECRGRGVISFGQGGAGNREERPARRSVCGGPGRHPRTPHAGAGGGDEGVRGAERHEILRGTRDEGDQRAGRFPGAVRRRRTAVQQPAGHRRLGCPARFQGSADPKLGPAALRPREGSREPDVLRRGAGRAGRARAPSDGAVDASAGPTGRRASCLRHRV